MAFPVERLFPKVLIGAGEVYKIFKNSQAWILMFFVESAALQSRGN